MKPSKKSEKTPRTPKVKPKEWEALKPKKPEGTDDSGRADYGGLPDRDLKKNLGGCG